MSEETLHPETLTRISKAEAWAAGLSVTDGDTYNTAVTGVKAIKTIKDGIIAFFKPEKAAAHKTHAIICAKEKSFMDQLVVAEATARKEILRYDVAQAEAKRVEQKRLQDIEDEKARKEKAKAEAIAKKQRDKEEAARQVEAEARRKAQEATSEKERKEAEALAEKSRKQAAAAKAKADAKQEQAAAVVAPVIATVKEQGKSTGVRSVWKARVTDFALVPRDYLEVNQKALDSFARCTDGKGEVPGVEMYEDKSLVLR